MGRSLTDGWDAVIDLATEVVDILNYIRQEEERRGEERRRSRPTKGPGGVEGRKGCDCPPRSND